MTVSLSCTTYDCTLSCTAEISGFEPDETSGAALYIADDENGNGEQNIGGVTDCIGISGTTSCTPGGTITANANATRQARLAIDAGAQSGEATFLVDTTSCISTETMNLITNEEMTAVVSDVSATSAGLFAGAFPLVVVIAVAIALLTHAKRSIFKALSTDEKNND
jgi:hypothetical protein